MDDIQVLEIIDNEETGGATLVVDVSRDLLVEVFAKWFIEGIRDYAEETLSLRRASAVSDEAGVASQTDQSSEELARPGDNAADVDWSKSFTYPHER